MKRQNGMESPIAGQATIPPATGIWYDLVLQAYGPNIEASAAPSYPLVTGTDSTFASGTLCLFDWSGTPETVALR
jgi:hypothetical protein